MNKKLKFVFHKMPIFCIGCLVAFTGCSGIEGTAENHQVMINLVTPIEQHQEKPENPRVHPGQPYNQGWWPDK